MESIIYKRRINYYETDRMGIVHHANYIKYFEEARIYFLDKTGMSYREMEELGIIMPVLEVGCSYLSPARFDDMLDIGISLSYVKAAKASFVYEAKNALTGAAVCRGFSTHGFLDASFRPLNIKRAFPEIYEKLFKLSKK